MSGFDFNAYHEAHRAVCMIGAYEYQEVIPRIECADGFSFSVQGSSTHYCSPRENAVRYDTVEVGYPSERVDALMEYAENPELPTQTVYGGVPVNLINSIVDAHGGIKQEVPRG